MGVADLRAAGNKTRTQRSTGAPLCQKSPVLYISIFLAWFAALAWFHPRMWSLTSIADGPFEFASIAYFVIFAEIAWLYGIYNLGVVLFALVYRVSSARRYQLHADELPPLRDEDAPSVAVLYTTCNDFMEHSALSCVELDYPNFKVYLLDDSSDPASRARVDAFAAAHPDRVVVVRRPDRRGFKAGNLNHALRHLAEEPLFAVVDADEILPADFLRRLAPRLLANPDCGFVQANHRCRRTTNSRLARDMGIGVDLHWKWYQPLRNDYGFVMFLGHGALLRRSCWEAVGGFPEIVSEDLAYAIAIREQGYRGLFAEDVVCLEEFPESVRAFRVRHIKWTRGTCEFLRHWARPLLRARSITWAEKLDILFPTLNLPMTFFFFLFMVNAQLLFPLVLGTPREVTLVLGGREAVLPILALKPDVARIFGVDFFAITIMTIVAPVLCFILGLWRRPLRLLRFLAHSTGLYAALSPLSFVAVVGYLLTGKARFLVTGDVATRRDGHEKRLPVLARGERWLSETHPDSRGVRGFELATGGLFLICALSSLQVSFAGLAIAYMLLPILHSAGWDNTLARTGVWAAFCILAAGISLGVIGVAGLSPVFFGYGFHF